jgi:hypothetical protein
MHDSSMLSWQEATELNVAATGFNGYRERCDESHPNHLSWRQEMIRMATGTEPPRPYPPILEQASSLFRSARDWVKSGFKLAPKAVPAERLAICESCEKWDLVQRRCRACGCTSLKPWAASSRCPLPEPKWREVT